MCSGLKADPEGSPFVEVCGLPVCKLCGKVVLAKCRNISNLLTYMYLRDYHPDRYSEACSKVAKKVCLTKGKGFQPAFVNYKSITRSILHNQILQKN